MKIRVATMPCRIATNFAINFATRFAINLPLICHYPPAMGLPCRGGAAHGLSQHFHRVCQDAGPV